MEKVYVVLRWVVDMEDNDRTLEGVHCVVKSEESAKAWVESGRYIGNNKWVDYTYKCTELGE